MFLSVTNVLPAFDSFARISLSELPSAVILDPRYVCPAIHPHVLGLCYAGFDSNFLWVVESSSVFDCMSERRWGVRQMSKQSPAS